MDDNEDARRVHVDFSRAEAAAMSQYAYWVRSEHTTGKRAQREVYRNRAAPEVFQDFLRSLDVLGAALEDEVQWNLSDGLLKDEREATEGPGGTESSSEPAGDKD